jgi:hypothetical protein
MPTIQEVDKCFTLMFENFIRPEFSKTQELKHWRERDLLPMMRVGLLCYFGKRVVPEVEVETPWTKSGKSRIDFRVGTTAIEFAVRNPGKSFTNVTAKANATEVKKLMRWRAGKSVLVLFDFSADPFTWDELQWYRQHPSLGKGNHSKNALNVLYYFLEGWPRHAACHRLEVRRRSRVPSVA